MAAEDSDARKFGLIFNNDATTNVFAHVRQGCSPQHYRNIIRALLESTESGIFVMGEAGDPDPVTYRSDAAACSTIGRPSSNTPPRTPFVPHNPAPPCTMTANCHLFCNTRINNTLRHTRPAIWHPIILACIFFAHYPKSC